MMIKIIKKFEIIAIKNKTSKDICVVFHIRSNYDYHFKIKIYYESLKDILIAYVKVLKGT